MNHPFLKTGMIIEMRDSSRSIIIGDLHVSPKEWEKRSWGTINDWDENLNYKSETGRFADIMKVWDNPRSNMEYFDIEARELIFNRE